MTIRNDVYKLSYRDAVISKAVYRHHTIAAAARYKLNCSYYIHTSKLYKTKFAGEVKGTFFFLKTSAQLCYHLFLFLFYFTYGAAAGNSNDGINAFVFRVYFHRFDSNAAYTR